MHDNEHSGRDQDIIDFFEEFDYALEWSEPVLGHVTGRVWEAVLPNNEGVYVVHRHHGTLVCGAFEPNVTLTVLPGDKSRDISFWIEGADHYVKDKKEGWVKCEQAEHICRLWCEAHAMDNKLIPDVRKKEQKPVVDPDDLAAATVKLRKQLNLSV